MTVYNFETLADDLLIKFDKRIDTQIKKIKADFGLIFDFLSDVLPSDQRKQLEQVIADMLSDNKSALSAVHVQTLNKVVREIRNVIG